MGEQPNPEPAQRRTWLQRVRGLSTTTKVIYGSTAVLLAAILTVALTGAVSGKPKAAPLPLAKDFALAELGHPGHSVSLTRYAGKPVIINFFASWCTPCKQETPLLASFYKHMHGKVDVIGIDAEDQAANALTFMRAAGVGYPVGFAPSPAVTDAYGVAGIPQTFFLNSRHRIVEHIYGAVTQKELASGAALMNQSRQSTTGVIVLGQNGG